MNQTETGTKSQKSRLSSNSKGGRSPHAARSPGAGSYFRNDMTDADMYEDAKDVDMSIQQMKMQFDKSIDMSLMEDDSAARAANVSQGSQPPSQILKPIQE